MPTLVASVGITSGETKLTVPVPIQFIHYLQMKRIIYIGMLISVVLLLICIIHEDNIKQLLTILLVMPFISLLFLIFNSSNSEYMFDKTGVVIRSTRSKRVPTGFAGVARFYLVGWQNDTPKSIEVSHWNKLPALLVKTADNSPGYVIPLNKDDIDEVCKYLTALCFSS